MKILFITYGYDTSNKEINKSLRKIGNKVISLKIRNGIDDNQNENIIIPIIKLRLLSNFSFNLLLFFILPIYLLFNKTDVLIFDYNSFMGIITSYPIAKLKRIKILMDIRSIPVDVNNFFGIFRVLQYNLAMFFSKLLCDGFTFLTSPMAEKECRKYRIKNKPIGIWTSGVNEELFNPKLYEKQGKELRQKLRLENKFVVFYHGVLSPNRGLQNALRAIGLLKKEHPDIILLFLGEGSAKDELKEIIKIDKLETNTILHYKIDYNEVPKYIAMINVGIVPLPYHPYWIDQSPLKVMEYLSMEKPIILTDIPAHKDIINEAKCGIFIKSDEPEEIKRGIMFAYNNKSKLMQLGKEGRKIVLQKYTWDKIAEDLERFLVKVKNGK